MPPLRERGDDIYLLINHFTEKFSKEMGIKTPQFTDKALNAMGNYRWPGNVRELENSVMRIVVMQDGEKVDVTDLPPYMRYALPNQTGLKRTLAEVEKEHIINVLSSVKNNKTRAADILDIDRKTLREKIKKYSGE